MDKVDTAFLAIITAFFVIGGIAVGFKECKEWNTGAINDQDCDGYAEALLLDGPVWFIWGHRT